ncbi:MAG: chromate transporter [Desulfurococcaceae archaeon TW002]
MSFLSVLLDLFLEFMKIGFFMFGGGYAGIALLHKEFVEVRGWLTNEEFVDIIGIAESTPGPVAINSATFVGYKIGGIPGSIIATLGVVLPAYLVILGIATGLSPYLTTPLARTILRGINSAVVALILIALLRISQTILLQNNAIRLVEVVIFIIAFILILLLKQHPITAIGVSVALSLVARYVLGV